MSLYASHYLCLSLSVSLSLSLSDTHAHTHTHTLSLYLSSFLSYLLSFRSLISLPLPHSLYVSSLAISPFLSLSLFLLSCPSASVMRLCRCVCHSSSFDMNVLTLTVHLSVCTSVRRSCLTRRLLLQWRAVVTTGTERTLNVTQWARL